MYASSLSYKTKEYKPQELKISAKKTLIWAGLGPRMRGGVNYGTFYMLDDTPPPETVSITQLERSDSIDLGRIVRRDGVRRERRKGL